MNLSVPEEKNPRARLGFRVIQPHSLRTSKLYSCNAVGFTFPFWQKSLSTRLFNMNTNKYQYIHICVYKAYYIHCTLCIYIYICTHIHLPNLDFFPMLAQGDHLTAASGQRALRSALGSHGGHAGRVRAPSDAVTSLRRPVAWGGGNRLGAKQSQTFSYTFVSF